MQDGPHQGGEAGRPRVTAKECPGILFHILCFALSPTSQRRAVSVETLSQVAGSHRPAILRNNNDPYAKDHERYPSHDYETDANDHAYLGDNIRRPSTAALT
jgi:hypothetical protein